MSIRTHSEPSTEPSDVRTTPPAVIDADENLFTVLGNQARSRSRAGLWTTAIGGAVNAGLVLWQFPTLSWLAAGFVAVAAYGGWGLVDRAIAAKNAESRDTPVAPDALPEMRGLIALAGTVAGIWAILGFMATALGNWHF